jgi:hypothetical protein
MSSEVAPNSRTGDRCFDKLSMAYGCPSTAT